MTPFSHTLPRETQSLIHRTMTGSSHGGRHASLAPLRYKALRRAIADIVAAIPTFHVREELAGAKNWHDCCAAVCKLLQRPGPAERCGCGGIHPPAAHCEPKQRATAAGWGQRRLVFGARIQRPLDVSGSRTPQQPNCALMTLFLWGKELFALS